MPGEPDSNPIFSGEFTHALDDKNRITVPARWRRSDVSEFFVLPHPVQRCLAVMPPEIFRRVGSEADKHPDVSKKSRAIFVRQFFSRAQSCVTDGQGRLVLPEEHCRRADLRGNVVLVGNLDRFEMWNPAEWKRFNEDGAETYQRVADLIGL